MRAHVWFKSNLRSYDLFLSFYIVLRLCRYISSKVEPSLVENIKMAAGFGVVRQYVGWLIFMYKVTSKIRFDVLLEEGAGFMTFSVPKSIYEWSLSAQTVICIDNCLHRYIIWQNIICLSIYLSIYLSFYLYRYA